MVGSPLLILVLFHLLRIGDAVSEKSNLEASIEATTEALSAADNDLVIGRASNRMILAELSAEEVNTTTRAPPEHTTESNESIASESSIVPSSHRPVFEFMPQFEHSSYDFMVPEGTNNVSTILAVISYLGQKEQSIPIFKISFDRMRWFEIGDVTKKELDNYVEYKVTINQRPDVYVQYNLTKNGSYKFSVEAHDAGKIQTASIHVDVLSLSPTTRRRTTSTAATTASIAASSPLNLTPPLDMFGMTTALVTTTKIMENTEIPEPETISAEVNSTTANGVATTELFLADPTTTLETLEEQAETGITTNSDAGEVTRKPVKSTDENEDSASSTSTQIFDVTTKFPTTVQDPIVEVVTAELQPLDDSDVSTKSDDEIPLVSASSNMKEEEGSGASAEATTEESVEEVKIMVEGLTEGKFELVGSLEKGSIIRGLAVSVVSSRKEKGYTNLTLESTGGAFDIRPKQLYSGNKAHLFIKHPSLVTASNTITIKAEKANSVVSKVVNIAVSPSKHNTIKDAPDTISVNKMVDVVEYNFVIPEDAASGTTLGQLKDGDAKKVVGPPGFFSLIGSDLILSCPDEGDCLDYEKQQTHHVLLVDAQGKQTAPVHVQINVQDVNDNRPRLEIFDTFIRLSNNRLIAPFLVQVVDDDSSLSNSNRVELSGSASSFLGLSKISENLYQVDVTGFAPTGLHKLEISVFDGAFSDKASVEVQVQNSRSHARFRRSKYSRSITADKVHEGNQLLQVELEGVPIDETRFVILHGNPGWLTIDDYGGRVGIAKFIKEVEAGEYTVVIGAVDRQSNALLAQTRLEIKVVGGAEAEKKVFAQNFYEKTLDREISSEFSVPFKMLRNVPVIVESVLAIDENGQQKELEKEDVTIRDQEVLFKKSSLSNLRAVSVQLSAGNEKATTLLSLTSSPEFIENRRQESARPVYPRPWTRENNVIELSIPEELPVGHLIYSLPAVSPMDGSLVPVTVSGDMAEAFNLDSDTGAISVARRLDFESLKPNARRFVLTFTAGSPGYESVAELRIEVENKDDNPPVLDKEGLQNELPIPENLPPSTVIARLGITDEDDPVNFEGFSVQMSGFGSDFYTASIINDSLVVAVGENGTLDREKMERHVVHLVVKDKAGNQDFATLSIRLLDENDNAPQFLQDQYAMQVVDNWPVGVVVDRVKAVDDDSGKNSRVIYSLATESAKYFAIDAVTGELSVVQELAGAAREQPYELVVVAEDEGTPSLSSSVRIKMKISEPLTDKEGEKGQVHFINPPVEFVLKLREDTPINEHIYNVKARLAGMGEERMNIKYTLKDPANEVQHFDIDESSGEVYVTKALDYEDVKYFSGVSTSLVSAARPHQLRFDV